MFSLKENLKTTVSLSLFGIIINNQTDLIGKSLANIRNQLENENPIFRH